VFTSNDIIILTFTPFICYFCKNAKISPLPYLIAEFVAANTWSMALMIGNPTNIYLASSAEIDFVSYFLVMWLPTLLSGIFSFLALYLLFRKELSLPMEKESSPSHVFMNRPLVIVGLIHLGVCTVALAVGGYLGWQMWIISLIAVISLVVCVLIASRLQKKEPAALLTCLHRAPWALIPFMLGMFVIVLALSEQGVTALLGALLQGSSPILSYGIFSTLLDNVMNNIPMSVLMGSVVAEEGSLAALYATVVGSNLGALLTPIGALAGIMWGAMLKAQGVRMRYLDFIKNGIVVLIPAVFGALLGLYIIL
jgi:arsenical pump membrane protein